MQRRGQWQQRKPERVVGDATHPDGLVVWMSEGCEASAGIAMEIAFFEAAGKPVVYRGVI